MAIILFYLSLVSIIVMFTMKYYGVSLGNNKLLSNLVNRNDENCNKIVYHGKNVFSKIKFKNFHKITVVLVKFIKKESLYLKKRFDSKQPAFFLSPQKPGHIHKHSISFFVKKASDYKDNTLDKNL